MLDITYLGKGRIVFQKQGLFLGASPPCPGFPLSGCGVVDAVVSAVPLDLPGDGAREDSEDAGAVCLGHTRSKEGS
ncbi:MAG: hypothetical protein A2672_00935 [Candidatus Wildermuthbacteria bacterium RIFCSPHIGHO2_01_FULL_49_22b]|uniref:Uncharacterized protein n=1 Tax=Candidatus Wildermuthbacteria bacterium RIFCSPHIGHO2_01_FULL_49_22b TaxID=1802448 RepID=A0A1G2QVV9_9BACT|nr:MAG: hypothetical protein A2672_00935 [Candidatus Wildermuthbacteria bacterium RIFCSPHIGHO2_01_FULL_49_22b]